ncbi:MAG: type I restriction endonuclease subunit R [[Eubacterium] sulci]|nr:type I restriction endonuclease subunit R [[Eubacterium] sulci]
MIFSKEADFEEALIKVLVEHGWERTILKNPTEEDLLRNWANILFENNRGIDRLNNYPLTDSEMKQVLDQVVSLRTPLKLSGFINGGSVSIKRDNPDDINHLGKEVSLKIYNRREIAAGESRYQIARQPIFNTKSKVLNDRRGDLMLLINGMPVIHIELKRSGVPVSQAAYQIEKYSYEGVFTGLFSLVQIFIAMEPNETRYFANPGPENKFNSDFYFHWADFNNEPINDWHVIASTLLSIPMAHQLIGFYTVADNADGVLKVLRSYQYYAANAISDKVSKIQWDDKNQLGGYIWHTTGSGKTMTSFKSAQLIASSKDADKVIFLMDRIELGTQSLKEYRGFAEENEEVQETEDTSVLVSKLKSDNPSNTLIVTSIQKMSNINKENDGLKDDDIKRMNTKRIVFIVDECHRSTFGEMLISIKETFPKAIFFGFTGTPIQDENQKKMNTTSDIFGNELHRYSIADGIRDKNVLGFDPYKILTYRDKDLRKAVALDKAKAKTEDEAIKNSEKSKIYYHYMNDVPMAGSYDSSGKYRKGIEDYIPMAQYTLQAHKENVVNDIVENWMTLSRGNKLHGIFATNSIPEAIDYYRLFKKADSNLKVTALFDPSIDNEEGFAFKEDGLVEIIEDYNANFFQADQFSLATWPKMKKDISARLAHKAPYQRVGTTPEKQIDLLIVVNQMLTGFDSKWINTLYLDKIIEFENLIQAFSRTNRLCREDLKPFGTIKYYRKPHTMERNIDAAVKLYSGDKPLGLFVNKLNRNLEKVNEIFSDIKYLFHNAGIVDFEKLPDDVSEKRKFSQLFNDLKKHVDSANIQGMTFSKKEYEFTDEDGRGYTVSLELDENTYLILVQRYKELIDSDDTSNPQGTYDIKGYITEIDTDKIDADYMNSRFEKFFKLLQTDGNSNDQVLNAKEELHKTFATLSQEDQKYANIFLHDIERGEVKNISLSFREQIVKYKTKDKDAQIQKLVKALGVDETKLKNMIEKHPEEANLNEFGMFDDLKSTVDKSKAKEYFEKLDETELTKVKVNQKTSKLLKEFILRGGFDIYLGEKEN